MWIHSQHQYEEYFQLQKGHWAEVQVGIICIHNSVRQRNNRDTIDINL